MKNLKNLNAKRFGLICILVAASTLTSTATTRTSEVSAMKPSIQNIQKAQKPTANQSIWGNILTWLGVGAK